MTTATVEGTKKNCRVNQMSMNFTEEVADCRGDGCGLSVSPRPSVTSAVSFFDW
jgi:hypothetical protein